MFNAIFSFFGTDKKEETNEYSFSTYKNGVVLPDDENETDMDLWRHRLSRWDDFVEQFPNHAFDIVRGGVPQGIRGEAWKIMSGGDVLMRKSPGVYATLLEGVSEYEDLIRKDVHRTFPKHKYFRLKESGGQNSLFNVLKAYSVMDTEVGYCQGMSFVCGTLLCHLGEEEAFWVMVALMKQYNIRLLYTIELPLLQTCFFNFNQLMKLYFPDLAQHFEELEISPVFFTAEWFSTLFCYSMNIEFSSRVLDMFFLEGFEYLYKVGLCIILKNEDELYYYGFEDAILFLKESLKTENPDIILKSEHFENFDGVMAIIEQKRKAANKYEY